MDLFEKMDISPMLIAQEKAAFDSEEYIFELKLDGIRCIAYLDENGTKLQNKRNLSLNSRFPELSEIHKSVNGKCILDGELYVFHNGRPDFFKVQRRTILKDPFKIRRMSKMYTAIYTAFDILYYEGQNLEKKPLLERKKLLKEVVEENQKITYSRYIEYDGIALYELTKEKNLEGIVAKRKASFYYEGKRSKDWIKCKHMMEDDFIILGYKFLPDKFTSLLLGKMIEGKPKPISSVSLGVSLSKIKSRIKMIGEMHEGYKLIYPDIVCTVKYMGLTEDGNMRQPSLKTIREDKLPDECI